MLENKFTLSVTNDLPKELGDAKKLESFRFINGKGFPSSYKDFVLNYGYGLTLEEFHIYIPMGDYGDSIFVRSEEIKDTYIEDVLNDDIWFDIEPDASIEILKNLYPFASSDNGLYLFWDISNFSQNENEFDIYITDFRGIGFRKVGNNLYECFENLTSKDKFKMYIPFSLESLNNTFKILNKIVI
ncbi:SMI1/KNR4 family protein [Flavobacterium columnare]|uniref:SMI1/KNR4 family protein n=1 Tax=Flavobacterium columnare TaxID=996 RepID=A0A8G0KTW7_9FLAO|nr:SMI1/KNR4 family protein [Flavobacterium davisii]QYS90053.1 SMI1/KNR4 family protein [Flavobacterium davisii]QYS90061.1 SMI1/KNR4 family protein [Flavobacterium davisii]QYS90068.1 SMI1/KNR4 family protein [Flavobacterium davisii]